MEPSQPGGRWRHHAEQVLVQAAGTVVGGGVLYVGAMFAGYVRFHAGSVAGVAALVIACVHLATVGSVIERIASRLGKAREFQWAVFTYAIGVTVLVMALFTAAAAYDITHSGGR